MALPSALAALCAIPHWLLWRRVERVKSDGSIEYTKPPFQARSPQRFARVDDSSTWTTYELALAAAEHEGLRGPAGGMGFVMRGGIGGIDLDECVDAETDEIADWALEIITQARECGCYVEFSPNLTGMHILGRSSGASVHTRWELGGDSKIELFRDTGRYMTVTGKQFGSIGTAEGDIDPVIDTLLKNRKANGKAASASSNGKASASANGKASAAGADSTPSGLFDKCVCRMLEQGLNGSEIVAQLRKYPKRYDATSVGRYEAGGRLGGEVERVKLKWEARHGAQLKVEWSTGRLPKGKSLADALIAVGALGIRCSNDEFHVRHFVEGAVLGRWAGELTDAGVAYIRGLILKKYGFDTSKQILNDALFQLAIENSFDPVRDYLDGLVWECEEESMIDTWVVNYLGAEDTVLNRAIGRCILIAAVRRVRRPGVKFDQIVVLEGEEGGGKSTVIKILAGGENFSDQFVLDMKHFREQQEVFQGVWLGEFADLKGIAAAESNAVKAYLSREADRARPAYGTRRVDQKRRTVLFGTTNEFGYLKGAYGNRRWWPLKCGRIRLAALARDRDKLWAEAAAREAKGESIELPRRLWEAARIEQDARLEDDPWDLRLGGLKGHRYPRRDGLGGWEERVAARDLYQNVLGLKASDEKGGGTARRVAEAMRRLHWEPIHARVGGVPCAAWVRVHDE